MTEERERMTDREQEEFANRRSRRAVRWSRACAVAAVLSVVLVVLLAQTDKPWRAAVWAINVVGFGFASNVWNDTARTWRDTARRWRAINAIGDRDAKDRVSH